MNQIEHLYGENTHILADPVLNSLLAKLCVPETVQPAVNDLVEALYSRLMQFAASMELKRKDVKLATRMTAIHSDQFYQGAIVDPSQKAVSVGLARAGTFPSHVCYSLLNRLLEPRNVRQDHIWAARMTNESNQVVGANLGGTKIGGDVNDTTVFLPDPMGATGGTIDSVLNLYKKEIESKNAKFIALHLIITPEYIRAVAKKHPDLKIYALRLDRGLSPSEVLKTPPGTHLEKERGLNENQYIVPGAGGIGEILNNSFC
ncbi:MAG: uracil phosphoribosyltransferase [Bdellovibrionia bacterium]